MATRVLVRVPTRHWRGVAAGMAMLLSVSACSTGPSTPMTPAQAQLQQANDRFNQTLAEGAAVGLVGGTVIGYLAGGARGAAIGAAAGGATGVLAGYLVASNSYEHARTEANLNAYIQEANTNADYYQRSADAATQIANDLRQENAALSAQYRSGKLTATEYRSQLASYRTSADTMRKQIAKMEDDSARLRGDAASSGAGALRSAADRTDRSRQQEEAALRQLDAALSAVPG